MSFSALISALILVTKSSQNQQTQNRSKLKKAAILQATNHNKVARKGYDTLSKELPWKVRRDLYGHFQGHALPGGFRSQNTVWGVFAGSRFTISRPGYRPNPRHLGTCWRQWVKNNVRENPRFFWIFFSDPKSRGTRWQTFSITKRRWSNRGKHENPGFFEDRDFTKIQSMTAGWFLGHFLTKKPPTAQFVSIWN